ncbi:interleukin-7 receptor subunit alpha [Amia ocellicauda]|uniref:interleukin-7 receptor subunit alpha n=1 Tax=Amia ocellicauda TaxID=2972642 RepID=UPI003463CCA4
MAVLLLTIFILFQPTVLGQSGSEYDESLEDFMNCTSHMSLQMNKLTCHIEEDTIVVKDRELIQLCYFSDTCTKSCTNLTRFKKNFTFQKLNPIKSYLLCIRFKSGLVYTKKIVLKEIIKPLPPKIASAVFLEDLNAAVIEIESPYVENDYLSNDLIYHVEIKGNQNLQTREIDTKYLRIEGKYLDSNSEYHVRVRASPNGKYFKGISSDWSNSEIFKTPKSATAGINDSILLYTLIAAMVILLLIICIVLARWSTEIKSIIWPSIPNPKNTLGQMYKSGKSQPVSFNPETFGDPNIHVVDRIEEKILNEMLLPPSAAEHTQRNSQSSPSMGRGSQPMLTTVTPAEECAAGNPGTNSNLGNGFLSSSQSGLGNKRDEAYVTMSSFYKNQSGR